MTQVERGPTARGFSFARTRFTLDDARTRGRALRATFPRRTLESPFSYYRGTAAVMANDLALDASTGLDVVVCGDAHVSNFGLFASPERRVVFDLSDSSRAH